MSKSKTEEASWHGINDEPGMPQKLITWRQKLNHKAKQEKQFRFYSLFDLVCHPDTLRWAWVLVRRNNGAAGIDGVTCRQVEQSRGGVERYLQELGEELKTKRYRVSPVKRVYIEKPDGGQRPLGIPVLKDRIVQTAVKLIIEPIFEADFNDCSYGYRPNRSAQDAVKAIEKHLKSGKKEVYDADLSGYFDSIPHDKLMACVKKRIVDGSVLYLIRQWLKAPVVDATRGNGGPTVKRSDKGTPQGGVISPLLANIYLHWFEVVLYRKINREGLNAEMVRYADDFVILTDQRNDELLRFIADSLEGWMKLKINREKTSCKNLCRAGERLDFLGYSFRYDKDLHGRAKRYLNIFPSPKALKRERAKLRRMTDKKQCFKPVPVLIAELNRHLKGWKNYYAHGYPRKAFRDMNRYVRERVIKHLKRRSQRAYKQPPDKTYYEHLKEMELIYL
jgi:RNA-directed DNA polymerase